MTDPHDPTRDAVDEALAGGPYLPDDGFTHRVLESLPPPRRARGRALVPLFALAAAGAGAALVPGLLPALSAWLAGGVAPAAAPAAALGALAAVAATGLLVAFAD